MRARFSATWNTIPPRPIRRRPDAARELPLGQGRPCDGAACGLTSKAKSADASPSSAGVPMGTLFQIAPERLLLLLGLSLFLGMAFEEYYGALATKPPGGVRTFPLLAFSGAGLFA